MLSALQNLPQSADGINGFFFCFFLHVILLDVHVLLLSRLADILEQFGKRAQIAVASLAGKC